MFVLNTHHSLRDIHITFTTMIECLMINVFCFVYLIHSCVDPCADVAWFSSSLASWWPLYWTYFKSRITSLCFLPRHSTVYPPRPGGLPPSVARLLVSGFFKIVWEYCWFEDPHPSTKKHYKNGDSHLVAPILWSSSRVLYWNVYLSVTKKMCSNFIFASMKSLINILK